MDLNEKITSSKLKELQEKYNKPRDPKQQEKYQEYEKKMQEIMNKPPYDRRIHYLEIGINEIKGSYGMDSEGYFYDPQEKVWCLYCVVQCYGRLDSDLIGFYVLSKKETEEEAFQSLYETFERNVKNYESELEWEKKHRMTKEEFLEWFRQDNREAKLAEKGPYQILWNRQQRKEQYAIGYYYEINSEYIRTNFGDEWIAYLIIDGDCMKETTCSCETHAIYMMRYWIQLVIEGFFDDSMTTRKFRKLQEKYNKPRDPKQQEKYQEYEKKMQEIMKKPPNDKMHYLRIGLNEIKDSTMDSKGYFYDPQEKKWCLYSVQLDERSNQIGFHVFWKEETEEEAFQSLYEMFERNVKSYEWELERDKNDRMTKEEFLEWSRQDNRESKLAEKGPYQILWNRQPEDEQYAVGYYERLYAGEYDWVAYVIMDGKCRMEMSYRHETRAIYMMRYWIQRIIDGKMG